MYKTTCLIFCVVSLLSSKTCAATLTTVLFSPDERSAIVSARTASTQSAVYKLSGIVLRDTGKSVAWINGRAETEATTDAQIPSLIIQRDHVLIEGKTLKVGDTLDIISGQRALLLPTNTVRVQP